MQWDSKMRTLIRDATADQLLDYLVSDDTSGQWTYYANLAEWVSLYNLLDERHFVGRLVRNLAGRGLVENRRAALGMQVWLTTITGRWRCRRFCWRAAPPWEYAPERRSFGLGKREWWSTACLPDVSARNRTMKCGLWRSSWRPSNKPK
jgi:hypothetical protein